MMGAAKNLDCNLWLSG